MEDEEEDFSLDGWTPICVGSESNTYTASYSREKESSVVYILLLYSTCSRSICERLPKEIFFLKK
jgi:hypothetical protein